MLIVSSKKNGSFFEILASIFAGEKKDISDLQVIVLLIHTRRAPCGICGPLLMALNNGGISKLCEQLNGEHKDFILEGLDRGSIKFLLEVSSSADYTKYGLIYSCCDGVTKDQYMNKVPTLSSIQVFSTPMPWVLPVYWHPFDLLAASYRRDSGLSAIYGNKKEKQFFLENLNYYDKDDLNEISIEVGVQNKAEVKDVGTQTVDENIEKTDT